MLRATLAPLAIAVLLLPVAFGQSDDALEREELEREFERLAYPERAHHHGHRHFRHHSPHSHLRRHHRSHSLLSALPATTIPAPPPAEGLLPNRYPAVAKKLKSMGAEMRDLESSHQAASMVRHGLESDVTKSLLHMNEAVGIKRKLARTEAHLHNEELKFKKLEEDRLRLDRTHGHIVSSLHHIMEPKIQFAETRLKQKQRHLQDLETRSAEWKAKETKLHDASIAGIEERKETKRRLEAANEAVKQATLEQATTKKHLEVVKHNVALSVESYRYAKTRAEGSGSEKDRAQQVVDESEHSVKRLTGILNMEQRRVDESMAVGKDRVQGKMRELAGTEEKSKFKLRRLNDEYRAWQRRQREWAHRVAATKQMTQDSSERYASSHQAVLDSAQAKVSSDAEADSDWAWDEWPGQGSKPDVDEVSLSAV